jgi:tight adherence protein B
VIVLAAICAAGAVWLAAEILAGRPPRLALPHRTARTGRRPARQVWLSQAGAAVTPTQFWATSFVLGALAFVILYALDGTVIVALIPALGVGAIPYAYWASQRRKRANARSEAWPDGLRYISGALGAGIATLHEALVELSISGPAALRPPMGRYARLADRMGQIPALEAVRAELADPVSDAVLLTFEIAAEEGTKTVLDVLDGLLGQISGDLALQEKIRTAQTQSRIAAWGCTIVPYALLIFLCATTALFRSFYDSPAGFAVVIIGAVCSTVGFSLVRRLGRPIPTTERIFVRTGATRP